MADEENGKKKSKGRKWLIIIPLVLVLAVGGGVAGNYLASKYLGNENKTEKKEKTGGVAASKEIYPMNKFLVNLATDGSSSQKYISIKLSLVISKKDASGVKKNQALIRDSVINVLRQKKESDILSGQNATPQLKQELVTTINQNYGKNVVSEIFITDMVIQ
ncbi:flagellar basal body-associated FliL family protein [Liquorilactobacillus sicerae]|uniref:flagellar basal body-associated FliL family protein n=1 Tax=Liquorilactobacillus sicerae TaxID=1416943 RepID=UPI002480DA83|nr:flagellar basal body-associated FliL family protein [Liquorilactobacillus sicerae]